MAGLFPQEEARNPTLYLIGKRGRTTTHVHDAIGRDQGLNRAPCGARPPMFGLETLAMVSALPDESPPAQALQIAPLREQGLSDEEIAARREQDTLDSVLGFLSRISCATCLQETKNFVRALWREHIGRVPEI